MKAKQIKILEVGKMSEKKEVIYLSDSPIEELDHDEFSHNIYVEVLEKIIRSCETPYNIGLFGEWGVGKTSIINMLKKRIEGDEKLSKQFSFLYFDVWKYANDSLRRQLLLHIDKEFDLKKENIEDALYNIVEEKTTESLKSGIKRSLRRAFKRYPILIYSLIIISFFLLLSIIFFDVGLSDPIIFLIFIPLFLQLIQKIDSAKDYMKRRTIPRREFPEQFEQIFDELIKEVKTPKIIIAVDNLDRCPSDIVVEMLGIIKTFMEKEKCIYIVPCDEESIKKHIKSVKGSDYEEKDANEFLRKFFQTHLTISPFLNEDLVNFAQRRLEETKLPQDPRIVEVITSAYTKNPRWVKQALNNITTLYLIAKQKEENNIFEKGAVTENLGFLSKICIIRDEWSPFYKKLEEQENLLEIIERYFRGEKVSEFETKEESKEIIEKYFNENPGLERFLSVTRLIMVKDIHPFLKLNQESFESSITELEEFRLHLRQGDALYIKGILKNKSNEEKAMYVKEILKVLDDDVRLKMFNFAFNCLNIIPEIYDLFPDGSKNALLNRFGHYITTRDFKEELQKFDIENVFKIMVDLPGIYLKDLLVKYVDLAIKEEEIDERILKRLVANFEIMTEEAVKRLNANLSEVYFKSGDTEEEESIGAIIDKYLLQDQKVKEKLLGQAIIRTVIKKIDTTVGTTNRMRMDLCLKMKEIASESNKQLFVLKMLDVVALNRNSSFDNNKSIGLSILQNLDQEDFPNNVIDKLYLTMTDLGKLMANPNHRIEFFRVIFKVFNKLDEEKKEEFVNQHLVPIIQSAGEGEIQKILEKAKLNDVEILEYEQLLDPLTERFKINIPNQIIIGFVLDILAKNREKEAKDLLENMIRNSNAKFFRAGLNAFQEKYEILSEESVNYLCNVCLERSNEFTIDQKQTFLNPIVRAYEKCSKHVQNTLVDHMLSFIGNDNPNLREVGTEYYREIKDFIESSKKNYLGRQLLLELVRVKNIDQKTVPILDVLTDLQEILSENDAITLIDVLMGQISEAMPSEVRIIGLEYIEKLNKLYDREEQMLKEVFKSAKSQDEQVSKHAKKTLEALRKFKGPKGFWKEVDAYF